MHRDERDHSIPAALSELPEFIAACQAHDISTVFALAEKYGLSRSAIARRTEIKTDHVREIINGRRVVESFAVYERIADGLGIPGAMLGLATRTWESEASFVRLSPHLKVSSLDTNATFAGSMADRNLPWLTSLGRDSNGRSAWQISEAEVELLRTAADDMDAIDQQFGGNRLWRPTRAHLLWVHQMIDRGIYDEELGQQLHMVAGKFTTSLGWFCYDAGLQAEARYHFSEALNTANFTGDDALASRTLSNMARQAVDLNKGREAVRFARLAQAHAKEWAAPSRVTALLAIREAQGHARVGDQLSCEASIRRAWQEWERGPDERDPDWATFLNEAELVCLEGMCLLDLGQSDRAQKLLGRSEQLQDIARSRNRGMCLGRL